MRLAKLSNINRRSVMFAVVIAASYFASSHPAVAVQTSMYENFTKCPTGAPAMNDPAGEGAACVVGTVRHGSVRIGNFGMPITSPLRFHFAYVGGGEEIHVVEGSTAFEAQPFVLPNPFFVPPSGGVPAQGAPPAAQVSSPVQKKKLSKKPKCKKPRCKKRGCKRHGGKKAKCKKPAHKGSQKRAGVSSAENEPVIEVFMEAAGEVHNLGLSALAGEPGKLFDLPLKLHLVGSGLGPSCYIGSESEPIVLAPEALSMPTTLQFGLDPNGFNVRVFGIGGVSLEDASFSVPGASGCGEGSLDPAINSLIGLPAAAGSSNALLTDLFTELVAAEYDGTPPEGGAELQAAFEAAR